jgi:hypothetical protein
LAASAAHAPPPNIPPCESPLRQGSKRPAIICWRKEQRNERLAQHGVERNEKTSAQTSAPATLA